MRIERNTTGILNHAQKKREDCFQRVDSAIQLLIRDERPVNFRTVSETAHVSTAWLYREPSIRSRIEALRVTNTPQKQSTENKSKTTDSGREQIIYFLKERIQALEKENRNLRKENEEILGQLVILQRQIPPI